jgi:hypothetical protein
MIKVLLYMTEDCGGWQLHAAWDDAVFGLKNRHHFEKVAVVSASNGWNGPLDSPRTWSRARQRPFPKTNSRKLWTGLKSS